MEHYPSKIVSGLGDGKNNNNNDTIVMLACTLITYFATLISGCFYEDHPYDPKLVLADALKASLVVVGPLAESMINFALSGDPIPAEMFNSTFPFLDKDDLLEFISRYSTIITNMSLEGKNKSEIVAYIMDDFKNIHEDSDEDSDYSEEDEDDDKDKEDKDKDKEDKEDKEDKDYDKKEDQILEHINMLKAASKLYDTLTPTTEIQLISARSIYALLNSDTLE